MALRAISSQRVRRGLGSAVVTFAVIAGAVIAGQGPGFAQTTYIGGGGGSGVTVNLEALDRLGPRQTSGRGALLMPLVSDVVSIGVYQPVPVAVPPIPTTPTYATIAAPAYVPPPPLPPPQPAPVIAATQAPAAPQPAQPLPGAQPLPLPVPVIAPEPTLPAEPADLEPADAPAAVVATGALDLTASGTVLTIGFAAEEADLRGEAMAALDALAAAMAADAGARVQLVAFAGATGSSGSAARRLSLSRALAVRAFLIERGVRSTRIDVRALGAKSDGGPPERVDVVALPR